MESLGDRVIIGDRRDDENGGTVGTLARLLVDVGAVHTETSTTALSEAVVRQWILPAVYERVVTGRGEFLAELRAAYPMFVRFGGIDYDHDPDAAAKLDDFVQRSQRILTGYGGNLLHVIIGDKGAYLCGVFGAPHAHEDDASRAATAALELLALERETAATDLQIGITHGRIRSGAYGHPMRRTFTCLGDAVNLSARLMSQAPAGQAYLSDDVHRALSERIECHLVGDRTGKGKAEPVRTLSLVGLRRGPVKREIRYPLPMIGREGELAVFAQAFDDVVGGAGRIVAVSAEAGRGKSRLIAEVVRTISTAGVDIAWGEAQNFGRTTSYLVWREAWRTLLNVNDEADKGSQRRALTRRLGTISAESSACRTPTRMTPRVLRRLRSSYSRSSVRRLRPIFKSASHTDGFVAAPTGIRCGARSPAWATPSTSRPG
jgi:class 3 adenylate cyclase